MFKVFENNKSADTSGFPRIARIASWVPENNSFETFEQAVRYSEMWLGLFWVDRGRLKVNEPLDFNGYGDTIEIREI